MRVIEQARTEELEHISIQVSPSLIPSRRDQFNICLVDRDAYLVELLKQWQR